MEVRKTGDGGISHRLTGGSRKNAERPQAIYAAPARMETSWGYFMRRAASNLN